MAKIDEAIRVAVERADWSLICNIYFAITGKTLEPPPPPAPQIIYRDVLDVDLDIDLEKSERDFPANDVNDNPDEVSNVSIDNNTSTNINDNNSNNNVLSNEINTSSKLKIIKAADIIQPETETKNNETSCVTQARNPNTSTKTKPRIGKKVPLQTTGRKLEWHDDGTLAIEDTVKANPTLAKMYNPPKPRGNRDPDKNTGRLMRVKCSLCGLEEDVSPVYATTYSPIPDDNTYKCNDCCTNSGRSLVMKRQEE